MEKILSDHEKVKRAEEIYYRRKNDFPGSKNEIDKKSYFGSKILFEILVIINLSLIIIAFQNKDYIFTEKFISDVQGYNVNLTEKIKQFIETNGEMENVEIEETGEDTIIESSIDVIEQEVNESQEGVEQENQVQEGIVPNDDDITKVIGLVSFQKPLPEGTITSRFGARESVYQNVSGYHTGVDIGAVKRNINLFCNVSEQ